MKTLSRFAVWLAALLLIGTYFLPLWRIDLWAPQYPEGLVMKIWLDKLSGDVDVINGLNHYIGMAHIKTEMFPEFIYMPYLVGFLIAFGLVTAVLNSRKMLITNVVLFVLAGLVALYDFWKWGYDYGHNLDPKAPIQVPGMAYQPPLIGYKALLNFGAYSMPDLGGWMFIIAALLVASAVIFEWVSGWKSTMWNRIGKQKAAIGILLVVLVGERCSVQPEPIHYGQDACHHCKMTIMDQKFSTEFITRKGKVFKFDDVACMIRYLTENNMAENKLALLLVSDYANPGSLVDAHTATFLQRSDLRSPMMGNVAAFANKGRAQQQAQGKKIMGWAQLQKVFQ